MSMPEEISMSLQRVLRTMISGLILVQCFTVYIYLASYIVLLYPVFLVSTYLLVTTTKMQVCFVIYLRDISTYNYKYY